MKNFIVPFAQLLVAFLIQLLVACSAGQKIATVSVDSVLNPVEISAQNNLPCATDTVVRSTVFSNEFASVYCLLEIKALVGSIEQSHRHYLLDEGIHGTFTLELAQAFSINKVNFVELPLDLNNPNTIFESGIRGVIDSRNITNAIVSASFTNVFRENIRLDTNLLRDRNLLLVSGIGNTVGQTTPQIGSMTEANSAASEDRYLAVGFAHPDNLQQRGNNCGYAREYCIVVNASSSSGATAVAAAALDSISSLWPNLRNEHLLDIVYFCANDIGSIGIDEVFGRGLLNLGCLITPNSELIDPLTGQSIAPGGFRVRGGEVANISLVDATTRAFSYDVSRYAPLSIPMMQPDTKLGMHFLNNRLHLSYSLRNKHLEGSLKVVMEQNNFLGAIEGYQKWDLGDSFSYGLTLGVKSSLVKNWQVKLVYEHLWGRDTGSHNQVYINSYKGQVSNLHLFLQKQTKQLNFRVGVLQSQVQAQLMALSYRTFQVDKQAQSLFYMKVNFKF